MLLFAKKLEWPNAIDSCVALRNNPWRCVDQVKLKVRGFSALIIQDHVWLNDYLYWRLKQRRCVKYSNILFLGWLETCYPNEICWLNAKLLRRTNNWLAPYNVMDPSKTEHRAYAKFYSEKDIPSLSCRVCNERLNSMRKTAVRWLYMEWYKKAVLGQSLPSVSLLHVTHYLFIIAC